MELKEKTGETAVISAGHGQTSLLTNNLFQVTNPFFPPPVFTNGYSSSNHPAPSLPGLLSFLSISQQVLCHPRLLLP